MDTMIKFGPVTFGEIDVFLTASAEDGNQVAQSILNKATKNGFRDLTREEVEYLAREMSAEADRVAEACGSAAGRAFERAAEMLHRRLA